MTLTRLPHRPHRDTQIIYIYRQISVLGLRRFGRFGVFASVWIAYLPGHCKLTLPRRGRQIHVWTPTTGPLQAHFTPQGPTNPRLDPYYGATASSLYCAGADKSTSGPLLPGHCKVTLPRKGRQIHVWNLTKGPLQAHFAPQGPTNPRLDPCYWATASSLYK